MASNVADHSHYQRDNTTFFNNSIVTQDIMQNAKQIRVVEEMKDTFQMSDHGVLMNHRK